MNRCAIAMVAANIFIVVCYTQILQYVRRVEGLTTVTASKVKVARVQVVDPVFGITFGVPVILERNICKMLRKLSRKATNRRGYPPRTETNVALKGIMNVRITANST